MAGRRPGPPQLHVEAPLRIDAGTSVGPHTVIEGITSIGKRNRIFQFASIGAAPQDKKYRGEPTRADVSIAMSFAGS